MSESIDYLHHAENAGSELVRRLKAFVDEVNREETEFRRPKAPVGWECMNLPCCDSKDECKEFCGSAECVVWEDK